MINTLNLYGLILNGLGGFIILICPPPIPSREIMEDGQEKVPHTYVLDFFPAKHKKWKYYWRLYGFRIGVLMLVVGFLLQIFAELLRRQTAS